MNSKDPARVLTFPDERAINKTAGETQIANIPVREQLENIVISVSGDELANQWKQGTGSVMQCQQQGRRKKSQCLFF